MVHQGLMLQRGGTRTICKAIMNVVKKDVMLSAGPLQVCTRLSSGCEAAVHAIADHFSEPDI